MSESAACMHAQLMRTARDGSEFNSGAVGFAGEYPEVRFGFAALLVVHDLVRPVVDVEAYRQVDRALVVPDEAAEERDVAFFGLALLKLHREFTLRVGVERDDHQPGRIHVEPVHDQLTKRERLAIGPARVERGMDSRDDTVGLFRTDSRDREHAAGFLDDDKSIGAVHDADAGED